MKKIKKEVEAKAQFLYQELEQIVESTDLENRSIKQRANFLCNLYRVHDYFFGGLRAKEVGRWIHIVEEGLKMTILEVRSYLHPTDEHFCILRAAVISLCS